MLPHKHLALSAAIGAAGWWITGEPMAGAAALASGVLPDTDHIVDYAYYYWRREHRLILLLHAYEIAVLGALIAVLSRNAVGGVAVLSYLVHLLADQAENRTRPLGYSLLFRARHRFRLARLSTMPEAAARGREDDLRRLTRLLRRAPLARRSR